MVNKLKIRDVFNINLKVREGEGVFPLKLFGVLKPKGTHIPQYLATEKLTGRKNAPDM
jgi:hypothetical protein